MNDQSLRMNDSCDVFIFSNFCAVIALATSKQGESYWFISAVQS